MNKKIISATLVIVGFVLGATALSVMADWAAPATGCTPPLCNADAPINASTTAQTKNGPLTLNFLNPTADNIGLRILGKLKMVDGSQGDGKVLTSNVDGVGTWQTPTAFVPNPLSPLVTFSKVAFGESSTYTSGVPYNNWDQKIYQNNILIPGQKYAFIVVTAGGQAATRTLNSTGLGVDNSRNITQLCSDGGSFTQAPLFSFVDMKRQLGDAIVSYQGTTVYNPTATYTGYVHGSWGMVPYSGGSGTYVTNLNHNLIWSGASGCPNGRTYRMIYVFDPGLLKSVMDNLYSMENNPKYKFNDPLSSDTSLHNGAVWTP